MRVISIDLSSHENVQIFMLSLFEAMPAVFCVWCDAMTQRVVEHVALEGVWLWISVVCCLIQLHSAHTCHASCWCSGAVRVVQDIYVGLWRYDAVDILIYKEHDCFNLFHLYIVFIVAACLRDIQISSLLDWLGISFSVVQ